MNIKELIHTEISISIKTKRDVQKKLINPIIHAGEVLYKTLNQGNKVLCCGNGGSASDAQHFVAELVGRYLIERRSFPAISLTANSSTITAIANDYGFEQVFSRQVYGLGDIYDILLVLTTSGNSKNLCHAINAARNRKMKIIAMTGKGGGKLANMLKKDDIHICIPSDQTAKIQESHIMILHCWCAMIDFKKEDASSKCQNYQK